MSSDIEEVQSSKLNSIPAFPAPGTDDEPDYATILINDLNKMGYTTESKLNDVWESLNEHCHNK